MKFQLYSWQEFDQDAEKIANFLKNKNFKCIYGIPKGGLVLAVKLCHLLDNFLLMDEKCIDRKTIIVDDVADSGTILSDIHNKYNFMTSVTIHLKPYTKFTPTFYCNKTSNWIVYPWENPDKAKQDYKDYIDKQR